MFKCVDALRTPRFQVRNLHSHGQLFHPRLKLRQRLHPAAVVTSVVVGGSAIIWCQTRTIQNDAALASPSPSPPSTNEYRVPKSTVPVIGNVVPQSATLEGLAWGTNRNNTLLPDDPSVDILRTPSVVGWMENVALRDLRLHENHAACVDARGDVYQWGDGFFDSSSPQIRKPQLTLSGKDIVELQLTKSKIYALSASGKVYALASKAFQQNAKSDKPTSAGLLRRGIAWLWGGEDVADFVEVIPKGGLAWRESIVSIMAGEHHLLALSSKGRVFAHPVDMEANGNGQLGFRHLDLPSPGRAPSPPSPRIRLELIPKSLINPDSRDSRSSSTSDDLKSTIDDQSIHFCPNFFEIPALRGVEVAQIAAGGRTSFVRTTSGRVWGWGANEHGQIGLGGNFSLETISTPTEVVLWQSAPRASTKCIDATAGGDLTAFTAERISGSSEVPPSRTVDLLMCGNGQWGGLGNNLYTNAQVTPLRVKNVSGLEEFSDETQSLQPIVPQSAAISPTGHVLLTLDTSLRGVECRDLLVWGKNHEFELGNGKKSSQAMPIYLESTQQGERFMLCQRKAKVVRDLKGNAWKRGVKVEQRAVVGYGNSVVYWKVSA